jgi:hypothetical protein
MAQAARYTRIKESPTEPQSFSRGVQRSRRVKKKPEVNEQTSNSARSSANKPNSMRSLV